MKLANVRGINGNRMTKHPRIANIILKISRALIFLIVFHLLLNKNFMYVSVRIMFNINIRIKPTIVKA